MPKPRRVVRAWAVMYPAGKTEVFQVFTNAAAHIYATRKAAYEFRVNDSHKVIQCEIRPVTRRKRCVK